MEKNIPFVDGTAITPISFTTEGVAVVLFVVLCLFAYAAKKGEKS